MTTDWTIRLAIAAILLAVGCFGGCRLQHHADALVISAKDTALLRASNDLDRAAFALAGSADRFRAIDDQTSENIKTAKLAKEVAEAAAARSKVEHDQAQRDIAVLEGKLAAEKASCVDGRRRICGLPLQ